MNSKTTFTAVLTVAITALVAVTAALASSSGGSNSTAASARDGAVRLAVFDSKPRLTRKQKRQRAAIRRHVARSGHRSLIASANVAQAHPVPIGDGLGDAWIAEADDGAVCTFIPDPVDGYGASCATEADLRAGNTVTILGGGSTGPLTDSAIVAVVVPDGREDPTVTLPDGNSKALAARSNLATGVVPISTKVRSGGASVTVPSRTAFECAPAAPGSTYRRCSN